MKPAPYLGDDKPVTVRNDRISDSVIRRLPRYYRFLGELYGEGVTKISSRELSERMRLTASQIRQDLNCFGGFGQQGYGYNVLELKSEIAKIIGVDKRLNAILIGVGNLGRAIAQHINFEKLGFRLTAVFDSNPKLENMELAGMKIQNIARLLSYCQSNDVKVAVLCIPKESARDICETLISGGVTGFWNFSHYDINLKYDGVEVENVHLGDSLLTLAYKVNNSSAAIRAKEERQP